MNKIITTTISEDIQPLKYRVARRTGAEKIGHMLRNCIEEHWLEDDFIIFKRWTWHMPSTWFQGRQFLMNAQFFSQKSFFISWCFG